MYLFRPEVFVLGLLVLVMLLYLQSAEIWSRNLLGRLQSTIGRGSRTKAHTLAFFNTADVERQSWEMHIGPIAAYAVQGRRPKMEDR